MAAVVTVDKTVDEDTNGTLVRGTTNTDESEDWAPSSEVAPTCGVVTSSCGLDSLAIDNVVFITDTLVFSAVSF